MNAINKRKPETKSDGAQSRLVATAILTRIMDDKRNLDALCDTQHGLKQFLDLPKADQSLVRAIVTTVVRNKNAIEAALNSVMDRKPPRNARFLIHSLHVAAAQILFLEIPDSAAVNIAVNQIGNDPRTSRFRALSNAILRRMSREKDKLIKKSENVSVISDWLAKQIRKDFGKDKLSRISDMVAHEPHLDITVKSDTIQWAEKLDGEVLPTGSIRLRSKGIVAEMPGFDDGEWWVQDAASALPAQLLGEIGGKDVLDLCAAPGGKTAQLINAGASVTAVEISKPRLERLSQNLERLTMKANLVQADILEWQPEQDFDAVLLDVPCSSTGTIRRHPDVMWSKTPEDVASLVEIQLKMIKCASKFVKTGGQLVYSNCSILKSEGEDLLSKIKTLAPDLVLRKFEMEEFPQFGEMINGQGALRTLPYHIAMTPENRGGMDAFFACRFEKV